MTLLFVASAVVVLVHGFVDPGQPTAGADHGAAGIDPWIAVVLAFPVAMALATGTEAPSTAIGSARPARTPPTGAASHAARSRSRC